MPYFACPYLNKEVELTEEREKHIAERHPDLLPNHRECIADTLADPDQIRRSIHFAIARLFTRWFENIRGGKYVVIVVVTETAPNDRHWVITAYMARKLVKGEIEWKRN